MSLIFNLKMRKTTNSRSTMTILRRAWSLGSALAQLNAVIASAQLLYACQSRADAIARNSQELERLSG